MRKLAALFLLAPFNLYAEAPDLTKLPPEVRNYSQWQSFPNIKVNPLWEGQCYIPPLHQEYMNNQNVPKGPHKDKLLSVFVNPEGAEVVQQYRIERFTPGSVIVKEKKSDTAAKAHAVGVMLKREAGFDASVGDWEFMYLGEDGKFTRGNSRAANCISCHQRTPKTDFIFGNYGQRLEK